MALVVKDRVKEVTTTTGTSNLTLGGAVYGFQSFSVIGNGNTTYYGIYDSATGDWEVGVGTYSTTGPTLTRDTVLESSNSGSKVVFGAGTKDVFVTYPAERSVYLDAAGSAVTVLDVGTLGVSTANISTANITAGTISTTPTSSNDLVNKTYVDAIAAQGISYHTPVKYEVPDTTGNLNATYNNGASGVGATLTNAGTQAPFAPDGPTAQVGDRILIYNQTNAAQNGVYQVTVVGTASTNWVLTRTSDANTYGVKDPNALGAGDAFYVTSGNTGAGETYVCNTAGTITFGTTAITFAQISSAQVYSAGAGLTLSNLQFSITPVGTASTYGSSSSVPVFTTNAYGQVTSVTNTGIAISAGAVSGLAPSATTDTTNASNITSGTLGSARLTGSYTGITGVGTLTAGTWNASTIGAAYGGTGITSYTVGDILYADGATSLAKLADVATGNALLSGGVGTAPAWGKIGLQTHVSGTLQVTNGGTGATSLTGYVYGNGTGAFTASTTIPNSATTATSANTASAIVARDGSGNFSAGTITASLSGNASTATSATSATTATNLAGGTAGAIPYQSGSGTTLFSAAGTSGQYLQSNGTSAPSWSTLPTVGDGTLTLNTSGTGLSGSASFTANQSGNTTFTVTSNATSGNTGSTIVARDASGNFSAGTITASLSGTATTATNWGSYGAVPAAGTSFGNANTIGRSDGNGYTYFYYINSSTSNSENPTVSQVIVTNGSDNFYRKASIAHLTSSLSGTAPINITGSAGSSTTSTYATYISNISLGSGSVNVNYAASAVLRTESGSGAALAYAPVLHVAAGDTMWQAQGTYGSSGDGTLYFRQGYNGSWGNWLTMLSSYNYNNYAPTLTGTGASGTWSINITGSAGSSGSVTGLTLTSSANGINPDSVTQNQLGYNTSVSLYGQTDGGLYSSAYSSSWIHQIYGDFRSGQIAVRGKNSGTWQSWYYIPTYSLNNGYSGGSLYAGIYYDSNNTGYYVDPASGSYLYSLSLSGNAYFQPNSWIQLNSSYGLYWPNNFGAHLHANDLTSYTQLATRGSKNGYGGFVDQYSAVNGMMYDSSGNGGVYREANGRWYFYYALSNDCMGIGTSSTSSTYSLYLTKGVYAQSRIDATIFYDTNNTGYYVDPAGDSQFSLIYANNWFRSQGQTGLYSASYGQHIYPKSDGAYWGVTAAGTGNGGLIFYQNYESSLRGYVYWDGTGFGLLHSSGGWAVRTTSSLVELYNSVYAPIIYDSNNSGYYVDPASTSNLNNTQIVTLGVGTAASGTTGEIRATNNITAYYSDDRLKTKLGRIENALARLLTLEGFYYHANETAQALGYEPVREVGVSAQSVQQVLPEVVVPAPIDAQYLTVRYEKLIPLLIEAVKELSAKVDALK